MVVNTKQTVIRQTASLFSSNSFIGRSLPVCPFVIRRRRRVESRKRETVISVVELAAGCCELLLQVQDTALAVQLIMFSLFT